MLQKSIASLSLACLLLSLNGCATTHFVGDGIVKQTKPLHHLDIKPGEHTKNAAIKGLTYGGIGGGIFGSAVGMIIGSELSAPGIIVGGVVGGVVGAAYYGLLVAAVGTSLGYLSDLAHKNYPHYEMKVQSVPYAQVWTVTQYTTEIPLNTKVRVFERNGKMFVRKAGAYQSAANIF